MALAPFKATIRINGINPYVLVSAARAAAIKAGQRKPIPVRIRINGEPAAAPWRINMMPTGNGAFYLYLHGDVRRASRTKVGDRVQVEIVFDAAYRNGPLAPMPAWFRTPLGKDAAAARGWDALTPSRRKEILRYLVNLKGSDARKRNVAKAIHMLAGRGGRWMARDW